MRGRYRLPTHLTPHSLPRYQHPHQVLHLSRMVNLIDAPVTQSPRCSHAPSGGAGSVGGTFASCHVSTMTVARGGLPGLKSPVRRLSLPPASQSPDGHCPFAVHSCPFSRTSRGRSTRCAAPSDGLPSLSRAHPRLPRGCPWPDSRLLVGDGCPTVWVGHGCPTRPDVSVAPGFGSDE